MKGWETPGSVFIQALSMDIQAGTVSLK